MSDTSRPAAFVLAATDHGPMIVNRFDEAMSPYGSLMGVGHQLLSRGAYERQEVALLLEMLERRRAYFGDGVTALDCGANIGVHTVEWARRMAGWGRVIAFEAQERIFYALAGNLALNNCFNAKAVFAAVGAQVGTLRIPAPDYLSAGSFGSLELRGSETNEFIGQVVDYSPEAMVEVATTTIDALGLERLDLLKIDVEGMEAEVLDGAAATIAARRPIIVAEHIKSGLDPLADRLARLGYTWFSTRMNVIAAHPSDPWSAEMSAEP